jgi:hypothetical protein
MRSAEPFLPQPAREFATTSLFPGSFFPGSFEAVSSKSPVKLTADSYLNSTSSSSLLRWEPFATHRENRRPASYTCLLLPDSNREEANEEKSDSHALPREQPQKREPC